MMMKITFLGTSSYPTKMRNSQSTLIEFENGKAVMVDCGEGTQRQLMHLNNIPKEIEAIYLTHHHVDHLSGLPGLIMYLNSITKKRIKIIAPSKALEVSRVLIETLIEFIDNPAEYIEVYESLSWEFGEVEVNCFSTFHTDDSVGYSFKDKDDKVTICGDLEFHSNEQRNRIIKSIEDSDKVVIDVVHLKDKDALELLKHFMHLDKMLIPVPHGRDELINKALEISGTMIPSDYDFFET